MNNLSSNIFPSVKMFEDDVVCSNLKQIFWKKFEETLFEEMLFIILI
jgi:hypothetical protein